METRSQNTMAMNWFDKKSLSDNDFHMVSDFVTANYGIKLPYQKKTMLESRLQKRLKATRCETFKDYLNLVFSGSGQTELIKMIDAISTNKTDFFREPSHFEWMHDHILPSLLHSSSGSLNVWCAAASTGEEIYTTAMVIEEYLSSTMTRHPYHILGTDISTEALRKAVNAIYKEDRITHMPLSLKKKYLLKSKDKTAREVRIASQIRQKATFQRLNLMDESYSVNKNFDIIFCRNVLIYFDKHTQGEVIRKLCDHLKPGGYFFLGHSESLIGKNLPLRQLKPTVYQKVSMNN